MAGTEEIKSFIVAVLGVALGVTALTQAVLPTLTGSGVPTLLATLGPIVVAFVAILMVMRLV